MSAIAGIYDTDRQEAAWNDGKTMMQALDKYPADDVQTWHSRSLFLGCHAQWITPESVREQLPRYEECLKLAITADAIIDNREELFQRLQIEPSRRHTTTDSELILLAYAQWGESATRYLVGDFAFVIWDEQRELLFGARDYFGNRSLYYVRDHARFAFCTTIEPLLSLSNVQKGLNESWLSEFLTIPYLIDTTDLFATAYKDINQIPAAHSFTVEGGQLRIARYGSIAAADRLHLQTNEEYEEAFREVFGQAVGSMLRTRGQVGATLSGGLDSGAVVSFAAKALEAKQAKLHTYSYVPEKSFVDWTARSRVADETPFVKATVEHVGNIEDGYLDLPGRDPFTEVDEWLDLLGMPYKNFENSFWIKGIYERAAKQGVGVLLTGARGNQTISWGSAVSYYVHQLRRLRWIYVYRELKPFSRQIGIRRKQLISRIGEQAFPILSASKSSSFIPYVPSLIHPEFARKTGVFDKLHNRDVGLKAASVTVLNDRENYFENLPLFNMQGAVGTKLSLTYSLWERDPTCDLRVVRFCMSLPLEQYVQDGIGRSLIRRATAGYLPDKVRMNQRIRGVQGADWLHRMLPYWKDLRLELLRLCKDSAVSELLHVANIQEAMDRMGESPSPEQAFTSDARYLMRSLVTYRFLKRVL